MCCKYLRCGYMQFIQGMLLSAVLCAACKAANDCYFPVATGCIGAKVVVQLLSCVVLLQQEHQPSLTDCLSFMQACLVIQTRVSSGRLHASCGSGVFNIGCVNQRDAVGALVCTAPSCTGHPVIVSKVPSPLMS